jgi:chromatin remodeling complex protein RSC6
MQTRSGKTYNATSSSVLEKSKTKVEMKVNKVDNRITFRMQTRSGKTYTATSSMEKNNIRLNMKVDNVDKLVNRPSFIQSRPTRRPISTHRVPCGFMRPHKISDELAMFLGKPVGTEMSRTNVSSLINRYIQANNLQDPQNGRKINPDVKLRALLKSGENDEVTYFNLYKYMKHHFIRDN